tara:strand:+ start:1389 stop:2861 length:1473 start_codon:yes stop_codon:yes gene_type:complete
MLSTDLIKRAEEDIEFKQMNIDKLQDEIVLIDNQKSLYDKGILNLERELLSRLNTVNESFNLIAEAYQDRIDADCKSDLFWRITNRSPNTPVDFFDLECVRLNPGGYELTGTNIDGNAGIGSTVAYVGATGVVTFYPASSTYGNDIPEEGDVVVDDPYFGFDRRNLYGLKIYSEPYDKDIGNTLIGEFIGTCSVGSTQITVMQPVGAGLTFGVGQIVVSTGKTAILTNNANIVGVGTTTKDIRIIPSTGIGSTGVTVNILTIDAVCGAPASAPEADGSFVEFRVLDDPVAFRAGGRKRYDIPFNQDPFTPQTISIANTSTLGLGVSVYIDNSGVPVTFASWNSQLKFLPLDAGGQTEPEVGAGKVYFRQGFGHAPMLGLSRAQEGDTTSVRVNALATGLYEELSSCSSEVEDKVTEKIGISSSLETALTAQSSDNNLLLGSAQALRDERNSLQLAIHGIRKVLGKLNEEYDKLLVLKEYIGITTVSDVVK